MIRRMPQFPSAVTGLCLLLGTLLTTRAATPLLPFYFESVGGEFRASGPQAECRLNDHGAALTLRDGSAAPATVDLEFPGARPLALHGQDEQPGRINRLVGNQSAHWQVNEATYARVSAPELYPGISAVFYGNERRLEYDLTVAPGARPENISLRFTGANHLSVDATGNLLLAVGGRQITQPAPVIYQTVNGVRHAVVGGYRLLDDQTVAFTVGSYDRQQPLVIDPILSYSTYFGGNSGDDALAVAVDANGYVYLAGRTMSVLFTNNIPTNAFQSTYGGGAYIGDGFVAKFKPGLTNLVYFTYLGGNSDDGVECLTVDAAGHAYVAGFTASANFPVTNWLTLPPLTNTISGVVGSGGYYRYDAFVAELETNGSRLLFSGYLGGDNVDDVHGIALDNLHGGLICLAGVTYSTNFPVSATALQSHFNGTNNVNLSANGFITILGTNYGTQFPSAGGKFYSTYFGGTNYDSINGLALDGGGCVYVAGLTSSTNFLSVNPPYNPLLPLSFTNSYTVTNLVHGTNLITAYTNVIACSFTNLNGGTNNQMNVYDAFAAKFTPGCTNLLYSATFGGTNSDGATGIAVTPAGVACVVGWTSSTNFPNQTPLLNNSISNNVQYTFTTNAFLVAIATNDAGQPFMVHSLVFGGFLHDLATSVALDASNNIYVAGYTSSTNFPATDPLGTASVTNSSAFTYHDAFVTSINSTWTGVLYSSYLGGYEDDLANSIAVDASGNAFVAGETLSTPTYGSGFPTWNAVQTSLYGLTDGFLAMIAPGSQAPVLHSAATKTSYTLSWTPIGDESPAFYFLQSNTNLLTTNWTTFSLGTWGTNVSTNGVITYQASIVFTNSNQFFTNKARFFRLFR